MDTTKSEVKKIKVLCLFDSPTAATGFAQVSKNILKVLHKTGKYDFDIIGINFDGTYYDREEYPYKIFPAKNPMSASPVYNDLFGKQVFLDKLGTGEYDLAFIIQDTFQIKELAPYIVQTNEAMPAERKFKWIFYYPIDAKPRKDWIDEAVLLSDFPVAYTKYAKEETLKVYEPNENPDATEQQKTENELKSKLLESKLDIIYHGVNTKDFFPIELDSEKRDELRKKYFPENVSKKFIFMNLNRNQPRKDLFRSLQVAKMLTERRKAKGLNDVYFYFHCLYQDSGLDIIQMAKQMNFLSKDNWGFPNPVKFSTIHGYPIEVVNEIYNCADAVFSTTLGEGFGLSMIEAMSVKKPILFPRNTCLPEIIGDDKGILVDCGKTENELYVGTYDNDRIRPITDVKDMVDKMEWLMDNPDKSKEMVDKAYDFAMSLKWDGEQVGKKWEDIFEKAYKSALEEREVRKIDFKNIGRNDDCPICKVKLKKCKHYAYK